MDSSIPAAPPPTTTTCAPPSSSSPAWIFFRSSSPASSIRRTRSEMGRVGMQCSAAPGVSSKPLEAEPMSKLTASYSTQRFSSVRPAALLPPPPLRQSLLPAGSTSTTSSLTNSMPAHSASGLSRMRVCSLEYRPDTHPGTIPLYDASSWTSMSVTRRFRGRAERFRALMTWTWPWPPPTRTRRRRGDDMPAASSDDPPSSEPSGEEEEDWSGFVARRFAAAAA
mmetsp:Transcript_50040/g.150555  ORF Transcript_50040/g.150555 Transcript_50040/m.150555 type:complete len:224 (-) Transcript_50040:296-967(-)